MVINIHHATAKKAEGLGIQFVTIGGVRNPQVAAVHKGNTIATGEDPKFVLTEAIVKIDGILPEATDDDAPIDEDQDDIAAIEAMEAEEELEEEPEEGKSVVKSKYRRRYRPFRDRCGDDLSEKISAAVADKTGKRTDPSKLKRLAKRNGVWKDSYANLNIGMQRMTVGVRLRAKVKRGETVQWLLHPKRVVR